MMTVVAVLTVLCVVACLALTVQATRDARRSRAQLARLLDEHSELLRAIRVRARVNHDVHRN